MLGMAEAWPSRAKLLELTGTLGLLVLPAELARSHRDKGRGEDTPLWGSAEEPQFVGECGATSVCFDGWIGFVP